MSSFLEIQSILNTVFSLWFVVQQSLVRFRDFTPTDTASLGYGHNRGKHPDTSNISLPRLDNRWRRAKKRLKSRPKPVVQRLKTVGTFSQFHPFWRGLIALGLPRLLTYLLDCWLRISADSRLSS
jgi:hypothetical protein